MGKTNSLKSFQSLKQAQKLCSVISLQLWLEEIFRAYLLAVVLFDLVNLLCSYAVYLPDITADQYWLCFCKLHRSLRPVTVIVCCLPERAMTGHFTAQDGVFMDRYWKATFFFSFCNIWDLTTNLQCIWKI